MKRYTIYKHPIGQIEAVKQGWSWPALFLGFIWALYKKMWSIGLSILIISVLLYATVGMSSKGEIILNILSFVLGIFFGMQGNSWYESSLKSRGYDFLKTVNASTKEGAIGVYLKESSNTESKTQTKTEPFFS